MNELTWVEISKNGLSENIRNLRKLVGEGKIICPCVKANAYGHGLVEVAEIFLEAGADWLAVNSLYEAEALRGAGVSAPLYILGYVALEDLGRALELECRLVAYNQETIEKIGELGAEAKLHLKVETGNNRQGLSGEKLLKLAEVADGFENIEIEGLCTHFANIEDTTDHSYAMKQLEAFQAVCDEFGAAGRDVALRHCANSAATILFKETHFEMVRPGIACYGMWPSSETYVSFLKDHGDDFKLSPAFSWKTKVAQIKDVAAGEYIGYGCTYRTTGPTKLAILPVGYYDGYDRGVSGGHVLIRGKRAPIRGRICMNIVIVDVTNIPDVELEDEVVLIGCSGEEEISCEQFAKWAGTINYEIPTRVNERIKRVVV